MFSDLMIHSLKSSFYMVFTICSLILSNVQYYPHIILI
jgi:hypothetical protein